MPHNFALRTLIACAEPIAVEASAVPTAGKTSVELAGTLVCHLRCGKSMKLPVRAEARMPEVALEEDEINF